MFCRCPPGLLRSWWNFIISGRNPSATMTLSNMKRSERKKSHSNPGKCKCNSLCYVNLDTYAFDCSSVGRPQLLCLPI